MNKEIWKTILITFLIVAISPKIYSQNLGAIILGTNNYLVSEQDNKYDLNTTGISAGWLIPINTSTLKIYYKVKASHHNSQNIHRSYYKYFFNATNEFLIGKDYSVNDKINIIPQLGFGALGETAYNKVNNGIAQAQLFFDLSLITYYKYKKFNFGIMMNYEKDILPNVNSIISTQRLNIILVLMK